MTRPSLAQQAGVPDVLIARTAPVLQRWVVYCATGDGLIVALRPDGAIERGTGTDAQLLERAATIEPAWASGLAVALLQADARQRRLDRQLLLLWWLVAVIAGVVLSWVAAT